jgi:hypothetical protein
MQDPTLKACSRRLKELFQNFDVASKEINGTESQTAPQPTQSKI